MSIKLTRRKLLALGTTTIALSFLAKRKFIDKVAPRKYSGKVYGANFERGHRLILQNFPEPSEIIETPISIVGSGISGLSAAYHLKKSGLNDFEIFELEDHIGGNATGINNKAPWGAHYLPLANPENEDLISFLREAEIIKGLDEKGRPIYDEQMICSDPMEKLYIFGRMQEGILPKQNLNSIDESEYEQFFQLLSDYQFKKGRDGKYIFNIPMEDSSKDPQYLQLDKITMSQFMKKNNWSSEKLLWYVNYCCRDDYGTSIDDISAWAGLHYFCARRGKGSEIHDESVLTWPEGNNFLVKKLTMLINKPIQTGKMVYKVKGNEVYFYDFTQNKSIKVISKQIILALPQFIISKLLGFKTNFTYAPWMVANIDIKWDREIEKHLAWDNVNFHGKGLGFVISNHQKLATFLDQNTLTYYWPLSHLSPKEARSFALKRTHNNWVQDILEDLTPVIFDLEKRITNIDIWPWGHGMIRPTPDFLFNERLRVLKRESESLHFAHTDMSGLSLFEEAFYQGKRASVKVIKGLS